MLMRIVRLRKQDATTRVIVLTMYDTGTEILQAIRSGTKAYLLKGARREELLDSIRRVDRGELDREATAKDADKMSA
jgi:DNA-binding NarL/FixJ family response regulator